MSVFHQGQRVVWSRAAAAQPSLAAAWYLSEPTVESNPEIAGKGVTPITVAIMNAGVPDTQRFWLVNDLDAPINYPNVDNPAGAVQKIDGNNVLVAFDLGPTMWVSDSELNPE
jgi:hypothetical protein